MKLDVQLVKQEKGSVDCGLACLSMILSYYGIDESIEKIKDKFKVYKGGTYSGQLAKYLIEKGFAVSVTTLNPAMFTLQDTEMSQEEILLRLKHLLEIEKRASNRTTLRHFIAFMQSGGEFEVKIPEINDVREEIDRKQPMIVQLTSQFFKAKKPKLMYHFNVVSGYNKEHVFVSDPLPDKRGGDNKYLARDFFYGVYSAIAADMDNGCFIKIKRKGPNGH